MSLGAFTIGGNVTYFTRFDQKLKGGPTFSVLGSTGFNSTFPSIQTQGRGSLGWEFGGLSATVYANYVGSFHNYSATTVIPVQTTGGFPSGGGDRVKATRGPNFYEMIGRKGGQKVKKLIEEGKRAARAVADESAQQDATEGE